MATAIILAGGLGTRLRTVISDVPKPMAPINGKPFLEFLLEFWINQGITRFILSIGYKHEAITDYFGNEFKGVPLDYALETSPLGTGGGLLLAADQLNKEQAFLLLNGDTYFAVELNQLIDFSQKNNADWCFSLFRTHDKERYLSMDILPQGQIISFNAKSSQQNYLANGGVYWVQKKALPGLSTPMNHKLSLEQDIFPKAFLAKQRLYGIEFSAPFIDIGIPNDYYRSADVIIDKYYTDTEIC